MHALYVVVMIVRSWVDHSKKEESKESKEGKDEKDVREKEGLVKNKKKENASCHVMQCRRVE